MLKGLYKIEIETAQGAPPRRMVARDGRIFGGNSAFAFAGSYRETGDEIAADIAIMRHNNDAGFKALFGADKFAVPLKGKQQGELSCSKAMHRAGTA